MTTLQDLLTSEKDANLYPRKQFHQLSFYIDRSTGITFELACLGHEPHQRGHICDGSSAREDCDFFLECFDGPLTTIHDGIITTWWKGVGDSADLWWRYATEAEAAGAANPNVHNLSE
ncbi:hypothetical protein [Arthrobacter sp. A2-55]|uniref:hypothetical protein n=1 Tax=Arthrobacter sp. A2-55 TaxID=2897337 RepID=UPI0021CDCB63|nr:hypothetical protein [Arthrobacter sp. A2-55]MCU6480487.1 hypothetical protein [Arthrobacter sp. A2-55]